MRHRRAGLLLLLCLSGAPLASYASTKEELDGIRKEMAESKKRQKELDARHHTLQQELDGLRQKLVRAVAEIQQTDKELRAAQQKLDVIIAQADAKKQQIDENKARLAALVQTALRFSKMPVEAMVVMPGDSKEQLRVSMALKMISQDVKRETEALNLQVKELNALEIKVKANREAIIKKQADLTKERELLAGNLEERKKLQEKLQTEQKKEAIKAAALAEKANGLQELLETLLRQAAERRKAEEESSRSHGWFSESASKGKVRSFVKAKGRIRLPVSGDVKERYGENGKSGSASKGISIAARPEAEVVAPYDGEVIYSGQFLTYGRMVIIKHSDDFHTLLAGLGSIDTRPGDFLLEGEPIGAMGRKGNDPRLYVELRKNNQPVNPAAWLAGL